MRILLLLSLLLATPAVAERPADTLARLRGTPSTNSGALGSDFPKQHVDAYRYVPQHPIVLLTAPPRHGGFGYGTPGTVIFGGVQAGPVSIGGVLTTGGGVSSIACPAPGHPVTTVTTTTVTTITTTHGGGVILAPALPDEPRERRPVTMTLAPRP